MPARTSVAAPRTPLVSMAVVLVPQPEFMEMCSPIPITATGALLVRAPPERPGEDVFGVGRARPHQTPEQPAQFGYGVLSPLIECIYSVLKFFEVFAIGYVDWVVNSTRSGHFPCAYVNLCEAGLSRTRLYVNSHSEALAGRVNTSKNRPFVKRVLLNSIMPHQD
jgi:hypothetical protein